MKTANNYRIDPEKLRNAFRRRHITATEAARQTGFSQAYYHQCYQRMNMPARGVLLLEKVLGITPEEYVIQDEAPAAATADPANAIDYDRVRGIVYEAVKAAMEEMLK